MRILIVGAGAVGGYFGGRLHQAGRDVTFLVREKRAQLLRANGLQIKSPEGDLDIRAPKLLQSAELRPDFDLVILSCKAYDLENAVESVASAIGPQTSILPLLNGMQHLDVLSERFGAEKILGGLCLIATTLDEDGAIVHLNSAHTLTFGERDSVGPGRAARIFDALSGAGFDTVQSDDIMQSMWEKWIMLATLASTTSMMRSAVGDILHAPGGQQFLESVLEECSGVAAAYEHAPSEAFFHRTRAMLGDHASGMTASMFRDISNNGRIEADHVVGDLIRRGEAKGAKTTLLQLAYLHLKAYEARNQRLALAS